MRKTNWSIAVIIGLLILLLLFSAGMFSGWGMMGSGMTLAPGAHLPWRTVPGSVDVSPWGYSRFGWIAMIFIGLIPVGFIVIAILGIVWLVRSLGSFNPPAADHACPNCGKSVQADWQNCPHCGTSLK